MRKADLKILIVKTLFWHFFCKVKIWILIALRDSVLFLYKYFYLKATVLFNIYRRG